MFVFLASIGQKAGNMLKIRAAAYSPSVEDTLGRTVGYHALCGLQVTEALDRMPDRIAAQLATRVGAVQL
jgi:hypothetical protein